MKDTYYFPHDYHARHDTKIEAMVNDYGVEGYGMYWVLIERLYESRDNRIEKFPKLFFGLATELCVSPDRAEKFVLSLINDYRLLEEDENNIWSDSVLRRMEIREQQRLMKVNSGRVGGIHSGITRKRKQNEAPLQEIEANEAKERKRKESKEKETSKTKYLDFVLLTQDQYQKLCDEFTKLGADEKIKNLNLYIGSKGDKYKSHYHTILNWARKEEPTSNKIPRRVL
jgi:hypothetical protein